MDELDPTSRAFIDKALPSAWPEPEVEQRVLTKLRARLAAPGSSGEGSGGESPSAGPTDGSASPASVQEPATSPIGASAQQIHGPALATTASGLSKLTVALSIVGVVTAIATGVAWQGGLEGPPNQPAHEQPTTATSATASPRPPRAVPEQQATVANADPETPQDMTVGTPPKPTKVLRTDTRSRLSGALETPSTPETSHTSANTLDAETVLIVAANAALARNDAQAVLELAERHARDFPEGLLRQERDALRSMALCKLRDPRAQATYTAFVRDRPASSHTKRVKELCRELEQ